MKRLFLVFGVSLIFVGLGLNGLRGEEPQEAAKEDIVLEPTAAQEAEPGPEAVKPPPKQEVIRPMAETYLRDRISELERRVSQLEQDIRFLEDENRNLDRRIDDLRQRHS